MVPSDNLFRKLKEEENWKKTKHSQKKNISALLKLIEMIAFSFMITSMIF